ncbi:Rhomboid-like protein, partial [Tolypocladium paradoxum]
RTRLPRPRSLGRRGTSVAFLAVFLSLTAAPDVVTARDTSPPAMASNDYYDGGNQRPRAADNTPSPAPYHNAQFAASPRSTPAPSYHSAYPAPNPSHTLGPYGAPQGQPPRTGASPFDTVFDDHAYPVNSRPYAAGSTGNISQPGLYQDTGYYGQGGAPLSSSGPHVAENIPLQDQAAKNTDFNDHIYDAPDAAQAGRQQTNKGKVRLGELGMIGADRKRIPWVVYILTIAQVAVFIGEIVKNGILTGSPIMIKPQFNPMIGPSTQVMINMGARFTPCMHNIKEIQGSVLPVEFLCPNATEMTQVCPLSDVCGFGGDVPNPTFNNIDQKPQPNQWYRFIIPIFMHAGLIHIGFNMLMQLTIAKEMEMAIGPIRFLLVYLSAGIFGFIMGGNFAGPLIVSTGASGSLFGIMALTLLDLLYSWKERRSPVKDLMFLILDMVIAFVLGLLPGLDNFSHIGGFLMGLGLGVCVLHSPNSLRRRMTSDIPYAAVNPGGETTSPSFLKSPVGFFKGRKPLWWVWWIVRVGALCIVITVFIVLLNNFYTVGNTCSWCKYLSCLPISNWCELGTIQKPAT